LFAAVTTVPNAKVEVLGPDEIRVSWDPVFQDMVSSGILLGFKIYYQSDGEPRRTIILVEDVVQHVIPALSKFTFSYPCLTELLWQRKWFRFFRRKFLHGIAFFSVVSFLSHSCSLLKLFEGFRISDVFVMLNPW